MTELWQAALPFAVGVCLWVIFVCSGFVVIEMLREWRIKKKRGW